MNVSTKIKELRAQRGWSQEQMAEKLAVSRQAVTKWETGVGAPDIENLAAIARLFGVTTDELIFGSAASEATDEVRYESATLLDVDAECHYDIHVGCARCVTLRGTDSEKLSVRLVSESIADLERAFKVALDTEGRNLDIDVSSTGVVADALARKELDVEICLPSAFSADAEIELSGDELRVEGARFDLEVGGKVAQVRLSDVEGSVELDVPIDMEIWAQDVRGGIDVNQVGATSTLHVVGGMPFAASTKGRLGKKTLRFTRNGEPCDAPEAADASLSIQLAGARCELTVDAL